MNVDARRLKILYVMMISITKIWSPKERENLRRVLKVNEIVAYVTIQRRRFPKSVKDLTHEMLFKRG
jgi:hypothetical protein